MTSQKVERTWICTGGYGRFRGEWVNRLIPCHSINFVKHCIFLSSTKREIRQFHIMVVQGWQRNVEKRRMYMQNCCFAYINLQCIALCRSCCCDCHHCFRFLITNSERYVFICRTSRNIAMN